MRYNLIDFIPYPADAQLDQKEKTRVLQLILFIGQSAQAAIQVLLNQEYHKFDAKVSENLCQIRAYKLAKIIENNQSFNANILTEFIFFADSIQQLIIKCYEMLKQNLRKLSSYSNSLLEFLKETQVELDFPEIIYFFTQSYILFEYKFLGEFNMSQGINYEKLCRVLNLQSKTFAKKFIHKIQRNLSEFSCKFIFELVKNLDLDHRHLKLLEMLYFKDEIGRSVLPCYEATKIILLDAVKDKKIIKILVTLSSENEKQTFEFFIKPNHVTMDYILCSKLENFIFGVTTFVGVCYYKNKIFETKKQYVMRFLKTGFINIILANMAQHPQYAGIALNDKKFNPYDDIEDTDSQNPVVEYMRCSKQEFLRHKSDSFDLGCAKENASLFLITHIFYDSLVKSAKKIFRSEESKLCFN